MACDKNYPDFWATPKYLSYEKASEKFRATNVFQWFLSIATTEGNLLLLEGIQSPVVHPILLLELMHCVLCRFYIRWEVLVHPHTRMEFVICEAHNNNNNNIFCWLQLLSGINGNNNIDRTTSCGETAFFMFACFCGFGWGCPSVGPFLLLWDTKTTLAIMRRMGSHASDAWPAESEILALRMWCLLMNLLAAAGCFTPTKQTTSCH